MRNGLRIFALLLGCFIAFSAGAQEISVQTVPLGSEDREAWMSEHHAVPVINVKLAFRGAGTASDPENQGGRAQMVASLLNEGAGDMDALAFQKALEDHAIQMRFAVEEDLLLVSMQTLSEHAEKAFELLGLALSSPRLDAAAIERVRAQMHTALRQNEEQPRYLASRLLRKTLFGNHPYANPALGTHESIDALTREQLQTHVQDYLTRGNMLMAVVGDITPQALQELVGTHLGALKAEFASTQKIPPLELLAAGQTEVNRRSIPQTVVYFGGPGVARSDPDFYAAYVMNHLLGGGTLTSRLGDEIREKRGLAYYAFSNLSWQGQGAWLAGGFGTRNEQAADALQVMMQTIREVHSGAISEAELEEAKGYLTGAFPLVLADNSGLASMLLSMQRFNLGKDYIEKRNDYIEAVKMEDVKRVAQRLLETKRMVVVGVGDPAKNLADYR